MRPSKRGPDEMRPVSFERGLARHDEVFFVVQSLNPLVTPLGHLVEHA